MPEFDETQQLARLVGPSQVGVGVAEHPAVVLQGEERQHARAGFPLPGQVMAIQTRIVAAVGDGVEVQTEGLGLGEQQRRQTPNPASEQGLLLRSACAVGVVGNVGLLGQDVQSGKQAQRFVAVEVVNVTAPLLIQ